MASPTPQSLSLCGSLLLIVQLLLHSQLCPPVLTLSALAVGLSCLPATPRLPLSLQHLVLYGLMSAPFQDMLSSQRSQMVPVIPSFAPSVASTVRRMQFTLQHM